jgi:uncharacterized protein (DUF3084 family)
MCETCPTIDPTSWSIQQLKEQIEYHKKSIGNKQEEIAVHQNALKEFEQIVLNKMDSSLKQIEKEKDQLIMMKREFENV